MKINIEIHGYMTFDELEKTLDEAKARVLNLHSVRDVATDYAELIDLGGADFKGRLDINFQDFEEDKGDPYIKELIYEELEETMLFDQEHVRGIELSQPIDYLISIVKEEFVARESQEISEIICEKIEEYFRKCEHCGKPILTGLFYKSAEEYFCHRECFEEHYPDAYPGMVQSMFNDKTLTAETWGKDIN